MSRPSDAYKVSSSIVTTCAVWTRTHVIAWWPQEAAAEDDDDDDDDDAEAGEDRDEDASVATVPSAASSGTSSVWSAARSPAWSCDAAMSAECGSDDWCCDDDDDDDDDPVARDAAVAPAFAALADCSSTARRTSLYKTVASRSARSAAAADTCSLLRRVMHCAPSSADEPPETTSKPDWTRRGRRPAGTGMEDDAAPESDEGGPAVTITSTAVVTALCHTGPSRFVDDEDEEDDEDTGKGPAAATPDSSTCARSIAVAAARRWSAAPAMLFPWPLQLPSDGTKDGVQVGQRVPGVVEQDPDEDEDEDPEPEEEDALPQLELADAAGDNDDDAEAVPPKAKRTSGTDADRWTATYPLGLPVSESTHCIAE
jgi:hypothetical protein